MKLIGSFWLICALFPITQTPDYNIIFSKIDNRVYAFVNDELVFDSQFIDGNPELNLSLYLNPSLKKGTNVIRIKLENGSLLNPFIVATH